MMTESEWLDVAGHISAMWPNDPVAPATAAAWYPLLAHLNAEQVRLAVDMIRLDPDARWQPTPGQIVEACNPDAGSWADAIPHIQQALRGGDISGPYAVPVGAYCQTLGDRRAMKAWDPGDPAVRAQLRDWWRDWHRARATERRRSLAVESPRQPRLGAA